MDNNLYTEIKSLSDKYASELRLKIDERIEIQIKIIEDLITLKKSIIERTFSIVDSSWNEFSFKDIFNERKEKLTQ